MRTQAISKVHETRFQETLLTVNKNAVVPAHFNIQPLQDTGDIGKKGRNQYFGLLWFTSGSGLLKADSEEHQISNNVIYLLPPGYLRHCIPNDTLQGYYISFSSEFLFQGGIPFAIISWLESYCTKQQIPFFNVDADMQYRVTQIINQMGQEFDRYDDMRSRVLSCLLGVLIIYLKRKLETEDECLVMPKDGEIVRKFILSCRKQFISKKLVSDYAAELCMSPSYLNKAVKKITGLTARDHIHRLIILEAKRLSIETNASMKEIGYQLGFDHPAHFSKFFKNHSGNNFSDFKKSLQELS